MKIKIAFSLLPGTLLSLITLYFAFKNVPFAELIQKGIFENKFAAFTSTLMGNIVSGFALVKSPKGIYICLVYSVLIWIFYSYFDRIGFRMGYRGEPSEAFKEKDHCNLNHNSLKEFA